MLSGLGKTMDVFTECEQRKILFGYSGVTVGIGARFAPETIYISQIHFSTDNSLLLLLTKKFYPISGTIHSLIGALSQKAFPRSLFFG